MACRCRLPFDSCISNKPPANGTSPSAKQDPHLLAKLATCVQRFAASGFAIGQGGMTRAFWRIFAFLVGCQPTFLNFFPFFLDLGVDKRRERGDLSKETDRMAGAKSACIADWLVAKSVSKRAAREKACVADWLVAKSVSNRAAREKACVADWLVGKSVSKRMAKKKLALRFSWLES